VEFTYSTILGGSYRNASLSAEIFLPPLVERYQNCLDFSYEKKYENYFEKSFEFSSRKQLFCLMAYLSLLVRMGIYHCF
jgi:hypothetical protein